ncbi:hypothetical protein GCM10022224_098000 [Nonomuraea antimicrobica]|uniref:LVIVD repeat-containing protein n=1 Tax=Nonomuraea antimicrobica TaxID=561173 RepID=A0ABP7EB35_9ACTN
MSEQNISRRAALRGTVRAAGAAGLAAALGNGPAHAERGDTSGDVPVSPPKGAYARNVEVIGYCDLDERPGFKMAIRQKAGRWYLYMGHFWDPGWSVLDVTDPARARVLKFLPTPEPRTNTLGNQVTLGGDILVTAVEKVFPVEAAPDPNGPFHDGVLIWDVSDPADPRRITHWRTDGGTGTHRNLYDGGRYAHLAANMKGFTGNIYVILDMADPAHPVEAGRWWVPGQEKGGQTPEPSHLHGFCCGSGAHVSLHGPPYPVGNHVYLPYGAAGLIVLDISDVARPRQVGHLPFSPPFHAQFGVHGFLPIPERGIGFANSEDISYGKGPAHHASIVDIKDPANPFLLSLLPAPVPPKEAPYQDFAGRGGWCGPHNFNHHQYHPDVEKQANLFYLAHFNAGLRVYDVSNPRLPREVGYFIPPEPRKRYGPLPAGDLVVQTEDVVVDRRGHIYITDKNQGLWILRYVGPR